MIRYGCVILRFLRWEVIGSASQNLSDCAEASHRDSLSVAAAVQLVSFSCVWGYCLCLSITHWNKWWM